MQITFHAPPMGGGDGGKNILGIVAQIGLIALSGGVAAGFGGFALGNLTRSVTTASLFGKLAGAAVLIGGSAVLQSLAKTPSVSQPEERDTRQLGSAGAQVNVQEPNAPLPRVVGTRKVFPAAIARPLSYFRGEQDVVEVVTALAGPHKLEDIRIGDALIDDVP
ncbi:MAG: hypothetical protein RQ750_17300, partial [Roseovarius sp.]|nr:hypothetical protein [Roseovarius sp.]